MYRVRAGESCLFAINALFANVPYPAWVRVTSSTATILMIPATILKELHHQEKAVRDWVFGVQSQRIFDLVTTLEEVQTLPVEASLRSFLLRSADAEHRIKETHEAIARYLGTAREVVTRNLRTFANAGLVALTRGCITILDTKQLGTPGGIKQSPPVTEMIPDSNQSARPMILGCCSRQPGRRKLMGGSPRQQHDIRARKQHRQEAGRYFRSYLPNAASTSFCAAASAMRATCGSRKTSMWMTCTFDKQANLLREQFGVFRTGVSGKFAEICEHLLLVFRGHLVDGVFGITELGRRLAKGTAMVILVAKPFLHHVEHRQETLRVASRQVSSRVR
jgi:hypothetical protein